MLEKILARLGWKVAECITRSDAGAGENVTENPLYMSDAAGVARGVGGRLSIDSPAGRSGKKLVSWRMLLCAGRGIAPVPCEARAEQREAKEQRARLGNWWRLHDGEAVRTRRAGG